MSEAPNPTELATTQLLPYLAKGGNEEAACNRTPGRPSPGRTSSARWLASSA